MGFKKFYLLEDVKERFGDRGDMYPTENGFTAIVKDPIPEDLPKFDSVTINPTESKIKGFVDREHLYIFDAKFDHGYILKTNKSAFGNMIGLNMWIHPSLVVIWGSGHISHHTKQEIHMIETHQKIKDLFPGKKIKFTLMVDPKQIA